MLGHLEHTQCRQVSLSQVGKLIYCHIINSKLIEIQCTPVNLWQHSKRKRCSFFILLLLLLINVITIHQVHRSSMRQHEASFGKTDLYEHLFYPYHFNQWLVILYLLLLFMVNDYISQNLWVLVIICKHIL